jgi:hypothetical protein
MKLRALVLGLAVWPACKPAPVETVDSWLTAYAADDIEGVVRATYSTDRDRVRAALEELRTTPTGTMAMSLPPRPLRHQIVEVESKDREDPARERWIVLAKTTLKNPLPFMSKRVGHLLEEMPKTREQRRRFLVVSEEGRWGVKLDLDRVIVRDEFAARFLKLVDRGKLGDAEAMLEHIPPPPDEANALKKSDRLHDSLTAELEKARRAIKLTKSATAAH